MRVERYFQLENRCENLVRLRDISECRYKKRQALRLIKKTEKKLNILEKLLDR